MLTNHKMKKNQNLSRRVHKLLCCCLHAVKPLQDLYRSTRPHKPFTLVLKLLLTIKCIKMHDCNISNVSLNISPCRKAKVFKVDPITVMGERSAKACEKNLSFCRWPPRASLSHTHTVVHTHVDITHMCAFKCTRATCRHIHHGLRDQTHLSARYLALGQNPNDVSGLEFT